MTRRQEQLASVIHRAAQSIIAQGFGDPRLEGSLITITQVKVTDDMRTAVLSVSIMPTEREARAMAGLKAAAKHIRHRASDLIELQHMPDLVFKSDRAAHRQAEVLSALDVVRREWDARSDGETRSDDTEEEQSQETQR